MSRLSFLWLDAYFYKIQERFLSEGFHCLMNKKDVIIVGWQKRRGPTPMAISAPLSAPSGLRCLHALYRG
jgi:hypothetical protein